MRICVISTGVFPCPPPGYSGLEMIAWQTAKGLAAKGHRVSLIAPQGSSCPGVEIISTGPPGQWDESLMYNAYWPHLPDFDVIIDHSWAKFAYLLKAEGRLKAPVLGVLHAPVNTMYQSLPPGVENPCFVCISKDQAAHFEALHGRQARHCYNGVDMDFYKPLDIPRSNRFLFLARFSTIKGPDLAIEVCRKAGAGLDLVGDTSITQEPEFLEKCKAMCDGFGGSPGAGPGAFVGSGTGIRMVGPAGRGECVWWFSQAHCLLHPNQRFREPFGLAPVEAMACGTPVIAWDHGAMRETIHPEVGWLVRSQEELVKIVGEAYLPLIGKENGISVHFRNRCREWASRFSVQNMVTRYETLCEEAIQTGGW